MSERKIVGCDRCKKEAEKSEDIKALDLSNVILTVGEYSSYGSSRSPSWTEWCKKWCAACRTEFKLIVPEKVSWKEPPPVTLEDAIREVMREEIQAAGVAQ